MCALVGSFSTAVLQQLVDLNSYRGQLSYSICSFDTASKVQVLTTDYGVMPPYLLGSFPKAAYYVGHTQAPTTESKNIHPAINGSAMLWHNGIIKQKELPPDVWDTEWLLDGILNNGFKFLSEVNGTFACILHKDDRLFVFRNEISPLFVDDELNLSSTTFEDSNSLESNIVFEVDIKSTKLVKVDEFKTKENPYFFL